MWRISSPNMWLSKWILDRKNSPRHSSGLPMVFTIIWSIWFHRSQVTYEGKTLNAHETLLTSTTLIDRYNKAYADAQMEQSPKRNTTRPPPPPISLSLSLSDTAKKIANFTHTRYSVEKGREVEWKSFCWNIQRWKKL